MPGTERKRHYTPAGEPTDTLPAPRGTQVAIQWQPDTLEALFEDPAISYWLKQAIPLPGRRMGATHAAERGDLARRDPLDALHDVEFLLALMQHRHASCAPATRTPEPHGDGK